MTREKVIIHFIYAELPVLHFSGITGTVFYSPSTNERGVVNGMLWYF